MTRSSASLPVLLAVLLCVSLAGVACDRHDETPVVAPDGPTVVPLDDLRFTIQAASETEAVLSIAGPFVDGLVLVEGAESGRFEATSGQYTLAARISIDRTDYSDVSVRLRKQGDTAVYTRSLGRYHHAFARAFTETRLVAFTTRLQDYSLSSDNTAFYYTLDRNGLTPAMELHVYDLATGADRVVDHDFPLNFRSVSRDRLVTAKTIGAPGEDRAMLYSYDAGSRQYTPIVEVSEDYLRLSEVVDGFLATNRPYWGDGPEGIVVDFNTDTVHQIDFDWVPLRPHTRDRIWLGNSVFDSQSLAFVSVPAGNAGHFTAYFASDDLTTVMGTEYPGDFGPCRVVVFKDNTRIVDDLLSDKVVNAVEGSWDGTHLLVQQSDQGSSRPAVEHVQNGYYDLDTSTGALTLLHNAPFARSAYQIGPGASIAVRSDGLYRIER